jgi:hypothetical protein
MYGVHRLALGDGPDICVSRFSFDHSSTCSESLCCRPEQSEVGPEAEDDDTERNEDIEALLNGHAPKAPAPRRSVRSNFSGSVALANGTALCHWELAE